MTDVIAEAEEDAIAKLLIELAFLVPRGTNLNTTIGPKLQAYKKAIEDRLRTEQEAAIRQLNIADELRINQTIEIMQLRAEQEALKQQVRDLRIADDAGVVTIKECEIEIADLEAAKDAAEAQMAEMKQEIAECVDDIRLIVSEMHELGVDGWPNSLSWIADILALLSPPQRDGS